MPMPQARYPVPSTLCAPTASPGHPQGPVPADQELFWLCADFRASRLTGTLLTGAVIFTPTRVGIVGWEMDLRNKIRARCVGKGKGWTQSQE